MKIIVNVVNDNKDKHLDSLSITSIENTLMSWSSYSNEAFSDCILEKDNRAKDIHDEFMAFIFDKTQINGEKYIHNKTGKWVTCQNAISKIIWLIVYNSDIRKKFFH